MSGVVLGLCSMLAGCQPDAGGVRTTAQAIFGNASWEMWSSQWGQPNEKPVPGDYDADGLIDVGSFRPADARWRLIQTRAHFSESVQWGQTNGDVPVPADFDGAVGTEIAVFRPGSLSRWFVHMSDGTTMTQTWGGSTDLPAPADFDNDGKADFVVYRDGTWFILESGSGYTTSGTRIYGGAGDLPTPGDYDGDGITDLAVFRPSNATWYFRTSTNGADQAVQWGVEGDVPVALDYDRDGKTDVTVWRPSTGVYYVKRSGGGNFSARFDVTYRRTAASIARPGVHATGPTALSSEPNVNRVWVCAGDQGDSVLYTVLDDDGAAVGASRWAIRNTKSDSKEDGMHACAPAVVKHLQNGTTDLFMMYYECAPRAYNTNAPSSGYVDAFTQICHASSQDGVTWRKWNEGLGVYGDLNTPPTPVIQAPEVKRNLGYTFSGGRHRVTFTPGRYDFVANYGVGHPSAIVVGDELWLYYYDSKGSEAARGVFRQRSHDGIHFFDDPVKTDLGDIGVADIKYFPEEGRWIATALAWPGRNKVLFSTDGIHFSPSLAEFVRANPDRCSKYDAAIVGSERGHLTSWNVNLATSEGYSAPVGNAYGDLQAWCPNAAENHVRGSTWAIYWMRGTLYP